MLSVDVKKKLGDFCLDISFHTEGGRLALLGASGSGKSVTLQCIAGIQRPDSGRIVLNGRVLFDSEKGIDLPPQKRGVGYLFQQYALFPHMTVARNIAAGARCLRRDEREKVVARMVERFRLTGLEGRYPANLSGGEKQRVALGRIFAGRPALLLLDEPFSALDSHLKWQVELELMDALAEYDGDTVYVSHDLDEVCRLCRTVCVLADGRAELALAVDKLLHAPDTVSAARLSGCENITRARRTAGCHLQCDDWGVVLQVCAEQERAVSAVGVRGCHVVPGSGRENNITCIVERVMEETFGFTLVLRTPGGGRIRMVLPREKWAALGRPQELIVHVAPEHVMVLTGGDICRT